VNDSGQRKAMYGFTARHIYTVQKLSPSADACMMKDSMLIKTDGWYIDLPRFNCPISYRPVRPPGEKQSTGCMDHFVTHKSGKGKLGFPISVISTIVMKDMHEFQTNLETIEFSTATLDSMLFEIPPGYKEAKSQEELQGKADVNEMIKNAEKSYKESEGATGNKKPGVIRVAVFAPTGSDQVQAADLQRHLVQSMTADKVEAVAVSTEEEARKYQCDYALNTAFTNVKAESKMSGVVKAIKKADPNAASNYNIKANLTLKAMSDASVKTVQSVDGKFEGLINEAAGKALDKGCQLVLQAIK
jgi:hypothetical protein